MNETIKKQFTKLEAEDKNQQYEAYLYIMEETKQPVDWAYEVWDELKTNLKSKDPHQRSRAAQFLSQLAISDPEKRILTDFPEIWQITYDPKFVTARHTLQSIWRVALAGEEQKKIVLEHLTSRYLTSTEEKNGTLIRFDIIEDLYKLFNEQQDEKIKQLATKLMEKEEDSKYQKKYSKIWK